MATLPYQYPTWVDVASRTHNGMIQEVAEIMSEECPMIRDGAVFPGNMETGHKSFQRTGLPSGTFRKLNSGVQPEKSTTVPVIDTASDLQTYSEVDVDVANLNGNDMEWMADEESSFIEGLGQTAERKSIYGDPTLVPEEFLGFAPRYAAGYADSNANFYDRTKSTYNVINGQGFGSNAAGTAGFNTSVYIVTWGRRTAHYFPVKGTEAGLKRDPKGQQTKEFSDGSLMEVYRTHYKWSIGLSVPDWRGHARVANIDKTLLSAATPTIQETLIQALNRIKVPGSGRHQTFMYVSERFHGYLQVIAQKKSNVHLSIDEWAGKPIMKFWGIPIRRSDRVLDTEGDITFTA